MRVLSKQRTQGPRRNTQVSPTRPWLRPPPSQLPGDAGAQPNYRSQFVSNIRGVRRPRACSRRPGANFPAPAGAREHRRRPFRGCAKSPPRTCFNTALKGAGRRAFGRATDRRGDLGTLPLLEARTEGELYWRACDFPVRSATRRAHRPSLFEEIWICESGERLFRLAARRDTTASCPPAGPEPDNPCRARRPCGPEPSSGSKQPWAAERLRPFAGQARGISAAAFSDLRFAITDNRFLDRARAETSSALVVKLTRQPAVPARSRRDPPGSRFEIEGRRPGECGGPLVSESQLGFRRTRISPGFANTRARTASPRRPGLPRGSAKPHCRLAEKTFKSEYWTGKRKQPLLPAPPDVERFCRDRRCAARRRAPDREAHRAPFPAGKG